VEVKYRCSRCGKEFPAEAGLWKCPDCGGVLELVYSVSSELPEADKLVKCKNGVWCFSKQLPNYEYKPSLGEGLTPIREVEVESERVLVKNEAVNPTGSFKDRGTAVAMAMALSNGVNGVSEDSSGNAGISLACYSRVYGIKAYIAVPRNAPPGKIRLLELCGAEILYGETSWQ